MRTSGFLEESSARQSKEVLFYRPHGQESQSEHKQDVVVVLWPRRHVVGDESALQESIIHKNVCIIDGVTTCTQCLV